MSDPDFTRLCGCGCGAEVKPRRRYLKNHDKRKPPRELSAADTLVTDTGHDTPCWLWPRVARDGYGRIYDSGKLWLAHRLFYVRMVGPIPEGLGLDHLCRVTACCNPDHLEPVTQSENVRRGKVAKLTPQDVEAIRALGRAGGMTQRQIGNLYGVSKHAVEAIIARRNWSD